MLKSFSPVIVFMLAACVSVDASSEHDSRPTTQVFVEERIEEWLTASATPSAAIAFIKNGRIEWVGAYGEHSPGAPAGLDTLYNVASMTKPIAAETILRLATAGDLSLSEPMTPYWLDPDLVDDPRAERLTPEIALTHRTGFPNWRASADDGVLRLQWTPGERTGYSGEGYEYVARFAEAKLGVGFDALTARTVFGPIGMKDTSYTAQDWFDGRVATPTGRDGSRRAPDAPTSWRAADDLHTTIEDYAAFLISVMNNQAVSADIAAQRLRVAQPQFDGGCPWGVDGTPEGCPSRIGFGLGFAVFEYDDGKIATQGGADWGERSIAYFDPESKTGVIILTNSANGGGVIRDVARALTPGLDFIRFVEFQAR